MEPTLDGTQLLVGDATGQVNNFSLQDGRRLGNLEDVEWDKHVPNR